MAVVATSGAMVAWPSPGRSHTTGLADAKSPVPVTSSPVTEAAQDNTDPYADGCKPDEKRLDGQKVYHKDGSLFGTLYLVYSRACQAEWGYLSAPNSASWTIYINAYRIPGDARTSWHFSGNEAPGSWGNVLSTKDGCVYAEAHVVDHDGMGPHTRTACIKP